MPLPETALIKRAQVFHDAVLPKECVVNLRAFSAPRAGYRKAGGSDDFPALVKARRKSKITAQRAQVCEMAAVPEEGMVRLISRQVRLTDHLARGC